jgi:phosphoglucomutase
LGKLGPIEIEVIDAVKPYVAYLKEIFDFDAIKSYVMAQSSDSCCSQSD